MGTHPGGAVPLCPSPPFGADAPPALLDALSLRHHPVPAAWHRWHQRPKAPTPGCSAVPPVTTPLLCSVPHREDEEEPKFNLFHAAFPCQMSQSTGLAQPLFCLAASAGFCLVFVQHVTALMALGLKPASAAE